MNVNNFYVSLRHTKKVEIDPNSHKLPPDWGPFEEYKVADYHCPAEWSNDGYFVPVEEGMPLWIDLRYNQLCACIVSVQRFNPVSNEPANLKDGLKKDPKQNYLVLPDQQWIDGYTKDGKVYQFVVTKAGEGLAVNEFVLPKEMQDSHAIGFAFFLPKHRPDMIDGRFDRTSYQLGRRAMWFSPIHTPQNWQISARSKSMRFTQNRVADNYNGPIGSSLTCGEIQCSSAATMGDCAYAESDSVDLLESGADVDLVEEIRGIDAPDTDSVDMLDQDIQQQFDKASMGAGGRIEQEIETDPNTVDFYQEKAALVLPIYLALPEQFKHIMQNGKRQDAHRKDKYIHSGEVGGVQVPLVK